jgi:hypothetical protein
MSNSNKAPIGLICNLRQRLTVDSSEQKVFRTISSYSEYEIVVMSKTCGNDGTSSLVSADKVITILASSIIHHALSRTLFKVYTIKELTQNSCRHAIVWTGTILAMMTKSQTRRLATIVIDGNNLYTGQNE